MNLPNKLTVLRVLLIPVFLLFYFMGEQLPNPADIVFWQAMSRDITDYRNNFNPYHLAALIVFVAAAITDALDGKIARKRGLVTDFGKLMDPLADKLLTMSAFVCLLQDSALMLIFLIVILAREFIVTAIRQLAANNGKVLAADKWGKIKTILQMVWISYALLFKVIYIVIEPISWWTLSVAVNDGWFNAGVRTWPSYLSSVSAPMIWLNYGLLCAVVLVTVASGINYCVKNRDLFSDM